LKNQEQVFDKSYDKPLLKSPKKVDPKIRKFIIPFRNFLRNENVKKILNKFPTVEDKGFVIFILHPLLYYENYGEELIMRKTLIWSRPAEDFRDELDNILCLLSFHFEKCFGKKCYKDITDLINSSQDRNYNYEGIKKRILRFRKNKNLQWLRKHYQFQFNLFKYHIANNFGFNELFKSI
jgi:hypothetical protein